MKKKLISTLLCVSMVAAMVAGCGSGDDTKDANNDASNTEGTADADTDTDSGSDSTEVENTITGDPSADDAFVVWGWNDDIKNILDGPFAEQYPDLAKRIEDMGADSICIKDMAGLLLPYKATELVGALKDAVKIPFFCKFCTYRVPILYSFHFSFTSQKNA